MTRRSTRTPVRRFGAGIAAIAVGCVFLPTGSQAVAAADGDVEVVNTETVKVYLSADGKVDTKRVYEQLTMTGDGSVDFGNPIETSGLRNLDGFEDFDVTDGEQQVDMSVDGVERLRTVSDFPGDLPLDIDIEYKLDGESVDAEDIVGEDGALEVIYTVKNVTAKSQEITYPDGQGGMVTETAEVPIPMVGSLSTVLPPAFSEVKSEQANMAGDGKGGTKMSFTMTLVPPIGSDTATFGYTAQIEDGVVPPASISALPVNPLESPTFKTAATSYKGGAKTGVKLTAGAVEIDSNLLKIRDGAAALLAGLIQLSDGASSLQDGLQNKAAPGAQKLADGAGELEDGLGKLDDGAGQLADGATAAAVGSGKVADGAAKLSGGLGKLDTGVGDLDAGASQLAGGQKALAAGLTKLYQAVELLPESVQDELATNVDYQTLLGALEKISAGVGNRGDAPTAGTLLGGVNGIEFAMRYPGPNDCAEALTGGTPEECGAMDAVQLVSDQLSTGATDLEQLKPVLQGLNGTSNGGAPCAGYPNYLPPPAPPAPPTTPCQFVSTLYYALFGASPAPPGAQAKVRAAANALNGVYSKVDAGLLGRGLPAGAVGGLDRLRAGLSNGDPTACADAAGTPTPADDCGIKQAAQAVRAGVPVLVSTLVTNIQQQLLAALGEPTPGCNPEATLRCAAGALADGGEDLVKGVNTLVQGVNLLAAGGMDLSAGAGQLTTGLNKLDAGASKLSTGTGDALEGSGLIADGAQELSTGLNDAADGSGLLAEGLQKATTSAPALPEGADRLSQEGMSKLIAAGKSTAKEYGQLYAIVGAGSERAKAESMAYGAPDEASGLTAYSFEIRGEDGESGKNFTRTLGALLLGGLGLGAFALRRRLI